MNREKSTVTRSGGHALARKCFCVIFLASLGFFSTANAVIQWPVVIEALKNAFVRSVAPGELKSSIADFEKNLGGSLLGKHYFLDGYAYLQRLMKKEEADNFWVVRDKLGGLGFANFYPNDGADIEECVRRLWRLKSDVSVQETKVFFVNPLARYVRGGEYEYSPGLPYADGNYMQDSVLYQLNRYGIDYIDLRRTLSKHTDIKPNNYFFLNDHHWRPETAFAAFADIVLWMNENFDANLDPRGFYRDANNYVFKEYPESFLGSMGRAMGAIFSGLDDFTVILPKFDRETDFTLEGHFLESYKSAPRRGTYAQALMFPEILNIENPYAVDFYAMYLGGIKLSSRIVNHKNPDGPKLLMIYDSYTLPVAVFMAPLFSEIQLFWHSEDSGQHIDLEPYLKSNSFDYIMVEMYEGNLRLDSFYFYSDPAENNES